MKPTPTSANSPKHAFPSKGFLKRRRALPLASTAAALGLAGCGMMGGNSSTASAPTLPDAAASQPAQEASADPALAAKQHAAQQLVQNYSNSFELALDQIDRERLRAGQRKIAEANQTTPVTAPAANPVLAANAATQPAVSLIQALGNPGQEAHPTAPPSETAGLTGVTIASSPATAVPAPTAQVAPSVILASAAPSPAPLVRINPTNSDASKTPIAAGLSSDNVSTAVITPLAGPGGSTPSAMGAMTASASPDKSMDAALTVKSEPPAVAISAVSPAQEPSLDEALAVIRKKAAEHPSFNTALALALLNSDPQSKPEDFAKSLPDSDQKVFTDLLSALDRMNAPAVAAAGSETLADRAAPLVQAAEKWQADADLTLPRLVLATRVDSFGVYNTIEPKFEQGKRQTVIIYCEVANFSSKKSDDAGVDWYTTSLTQQETLITDDGLMVWRPNPEDVEDRSRNQRKDFYLVKKLTIPENLAAGKYTLRMKVTDRNSNKSQNVGLTLEIVGK